VVTAAALVGLLSLGCGGAPPVPTQPPDSPSATVDPAATPAEQPGATDGLPEPTLVVSPTPAGTVAEPTPMLTLPTVATPTPALTIPPVPEPTPTMAPVPLPTPTADPTPRAAAILRFRREGHGSGPRNVVDCTVPSFDGTITLAWLVRRATGVALAIDGPGTYDSYSGTSGEANVPFACEEAKHTYTLTTTGGEGPPASVTRTVRRGEPRIVDFAVIGPNCASPADSAPVSVTYEVASATGAELWVDGALYASYAGRASGPQGNDAGTYDCSRESQSYMLRTTGGFGQAAELTLSARP
jgi:hypothetical protein